MGLDVTLLDEDALAAGDLSRYDTIVVGVRASEVRPDFVAANERLLDFVRAGRNLDRAVPARSLRGRKAPAIPRFRRGGPGHG